MFFADKSATLKWMFPKIRVGPLNGWFIMENLWTNGWFGGTSMIGVPWFTFTLLLHLHPTTIASKGPSSCSTCRCFCSFASSAASSSGLIEVSFGDTCKKKNTKNAPEMFQFTFGPAGIPLTCDCYLPGKRDDLPKFSKKEKGTVGWTEYRKTWPTHVETYIFVLMRVFKTPRKVGKCL